MDTDLSDSLLAKIEMESDKVKNSDDSLGMIKEKRLASKMAISLLMQGMVK